MRRLILLSGAACAMALGAGFVSASSSQADERSPFQLLGTAPVAAAGGPSSALQVTPVRWGWGSGYYRPYGGYGGYGSYSRPYSSYYRGGYGSYYRGGYGNYYGGGYGGYGYRPYYNSYRPYNGGYYGYRPGLNLWYGF